MYCSQVLESFGDFLKTRQACHRAIFDSGTGEAGSLRDSADAILSEAIRFKAAAALKVHRFAVKTYEHRENQPTVPLSAPAE